VKGFEILLTKLFSRLKLSEWEKDKRSRKSDLT